MRRVPDTKFEHLAELTPENFDEQARDKAAEYINQLYDHYRKTFYQANSLKDRFFNVKLSEDAALFNRIKDDYYNESVSSIVRREFGKNKIVRQGNELVQLFEPIYQLPEPEKWYSFRTHFFAPVKHFAGTVFETLWFNIVMVWLLTIMCYAVLYFDLLKKSLTWLGSIKLRKKKPLRV